VRKNNRLPNFKNLSIHLRILLIVYGLAMTGAVLLSNSPKQFLSVLSAMSAAIMPTLLLSAICLYCMQPFIAKRKYQHGVLIILLLTVSISAFVFWGLNQATSMTSISTPRACLLTLIVTGILLGYFNLQQRAYSPAIAEARLQALQARIRPHFLFNSINAVLSLIRSQPKQAETALEDMADLFRVLMADNRDLVPLAQEIALCRQYLSIEKLRLAERLTVAWDMDAMPQDAMIPPLILQPLLENAVYHGIEPLADGGTITVTIAAIEKVDVLITISNPYQSDKDKHQGNKLALKNIKERLLLHFDLVASIKSSTQAIDDQTMYQVEIRIPGSAL